MPHKSRTAVFRMYGITACYTGGVMERTEALKATTKFSGSNWVIRLRVYIFSVRTTDYRSNFPYKIFTGVTYIF